METNIKIKKKIFKEIKAWNHKEIYFFLYLEFFINFAKRKNITNLIFFYFYKKKTEKRIYKLKRIDGID